VPLTDRSENDTSSHVHSDCGSIEPDAKSRAWAALEYAFSEIDPIQLIYLRLVFFEDVSKKEVAKAFGCHPSNVGRKLKKAIKTLRVKTEAFQKRYPDADRVEWSDLLAICKSPPVFFYEN
jgi:DNA-directed RNA polymerase specialized sigma24 family protein